MPNMIICSVVKKALQEIGYIKDIAVKRQQPHSFELSWTLDAKKLTNFLEAIAVSNFKSCSISADD